MKPKLLLCGPEAYAHIGYAQKRYAQLEAMQALPRSTVIGNCLIQFKRGKITIIPLVSEYALFLWNPVTSTYYDKFTDTVAKVWPDFTKLLPTLTAFYPIYPDQLAVPLYDRVSTYDAGSSTVDQVITFATPILSAHSENLSWQGLMMQPNLDTGNQMYLLRYQLTGYLSPYVQPMATKIILASDSTNLFEADFEAQSVYPAARFARPGIYYRRLIDADTERMIVCAQDDATYSGQVYEVLETSGSLGLSPFGLADLPAGSRLPAGLGPGYTDTGTNGRHVDYQYDIFTAEKALHYYVVKFCSDAAVARNVVNDSYAYPNDVQLFPGMSLTVEKRLKTDLSLVTTYNLTPSAVDWTLEDITCPQAFWNAANAETHGYTSGTDDLTRFVPQGSGFVLVDAAGVEYPVLPVLACSQDYFWKTALNEWIPYVDRTPATVSTYGLQRTVFQQSALLWLGTPPGGLDCYTWPDVDAAGLKILEAVTDVITDTPIGLVRQFGSAIGDSNRVLIQAMPFDSQLVIFWAVAVTETVMTIECRYLGASTVAVGDRLHLDTDETPCYYAVTSGDLVGSDTAIQESIIGNLIAAFNAVSTNYQAVYGGNGVDGFGYYTRLTVERITDGVLNVYPTFTLFTQGQSNRYDILSVRTDEDVLKVQREKTYPTLQTSFMFGI